ncbi:glycosyltransferase family 9 protein [Granulicella cerasi]|uniref:Glycosyltransferase family 9 protein n=1 Tax=Granulicella cerasi TaxID=741063 RepID=A0ABW1ZBV9_9BACT|nr:glycosyltransferase family 9 protein [Granulicella cerasi]
MKVLIVRVGAMGDVLHALPAAAALKRMRPETRIDWVIDERWQPLLTNWDEPGPVVDRSFAVPIRKWKQKPFSRETLASLLAFRKLRGQYDLVVDMQGTLRSALIGRLAGGKTLAGYSDPREGFAANLYGRKCVRRGTHVVDQGLSLLGDAVGVELESVLAKGVALPRIGWAEEWAEREAVLRRPLALLAAGGGWGAKSWPNAKFGALATQLREAGYDVVVNAAKKDAPDALEVIAASEGAARMVVCNVAGLVALMRRVDLCVGNDSGPMHLAATLAVPTVALFGPTSPERNGPWGPGPSVVLRRPLSQTTYKRTAETEAGLASISVEDVMTAVNPDAASRIADPLRQ